MADFERDLPNTDSGVIIDRESFCARNCDCHKTSRRQFLIGAGLVALSSALPVNRLHAGYVPANFSTIVPPVKSMNPDWLRSLTERGEPAVYTDHDLDHIGMPVGGIGAGQVYLTGDGVLKHWDIFNANNVSGYGYLGQGTPYSTLDQGFALNIITPSGGEVRPLNSSGFTTCTFAGTYPIGTVTYADPAVPVTVKLEAYTPFVPGKADLSSHPASVLEYTVTNPSSAAVECDIAGWMPNAVLFVNRNRWSGSQTNTAIRTPAYSTVIFSASSADIGDPRPAIKFEDFDSGTYDGWTMEGAAFGDKPSTGPSRDDQHITGDFGKGLVNTYTTKEGDEATGKLTSPDFIVVRRLIVFNIAGGNHPGQTCINLMVDGAVVRTMTGQNTDVLAAGVWDVSEFAGKTAHIEIVDSIGGGWGHILIDDIQFSDVPHVPGASFETLTDYGTMALAVLGSEPGDFIKADGGSESDIEDVFPQSGDSPVDQHSTTLGGNSFGSVGRKLLLKPGESTRVVFIAAWYFPNLNIEGLADGKGRYYSNLFSSAADVVAKLSQNLPELRSATYAWRDAWYDSTLPYWFLDRAMANVSCLCTETVVRLASGRFYGWEGVHCCDGTCTHVYHYAQGAARIFPELERDTRERVNYGVGFNPQTGAIGNRGEFDRSAASDGQAGTILRTLREHQMSRDAAFLKRVYSKAKLAMQYLMAQDPGNAGILSGPQPNTLDAVWYGGVPWISSLYIAALRASSQMATEVGDSEFAALTQHIADAGTINLPKRMWNGEYFIQNIDPAHTDAISTGTGCEIDQVLGQSWAMQIGLPRVVDEDHSKAALRALWKYNFVPDIGPFRNIYKAGRWTAGAGESGMIMCAYPATPIAQVVADTAKNFATAYFNECMTGFEHQVASHMIAEGMITEGLAVMRSVHDRVHPAKRNPYNEPECGDHYSRAMASYGSFITITGFEYHGPKGHIAFAPKLTPNNFKCAFTAAEGWGSFSQHQSGGSYKASLEVKYGVLRLTKVMLRPPAPAANKKFTVLLAGKIVESVAATMVAGQLIINLPNFVTIAKGQSLTVTTA